MVFRMAQRMHRREPRSNTVARYRKPSRVGLYAMSPIQIRFRATPCTSNWRANKLGAIGWSCCASVVTTRGRFRGRGTRDVIMGHQHVVDDLSPALRPLEIRVGAGHGHVAPQRDSFAKYVATFYERLFLARRGHLAPEPPILLLLRLARRRRPRAARLTLESLPRPQLVWTDIELAADLGQRRAGRPPITSRGFPIRFHVLPPPRN